ncbi:MAG: hypothetical protein HDS85_01715 [Bacteroidales bacterium]|nr:hypothetical protein [Bacteroidales bacterium]
MTEFDKKLIEKALHFRRYDYRDISVLMKIADTNEGCKRLNCIQMDLEDLVRETI